MKGTYLLCLLLKERIELEVAALGNLEFNKGNYIYVGSAMANKGSSSLINRVKRHLKDSAEKKLHWHIDFFLKNKKVEIIKIYLIPSKIKLECTIAKELEKSSEDSIKNFGSSDCKCKSHLFYFNKLIPNSLELILSK